LTLKVTNDFQIVSRAIPYGLGTISANDLEMTLRYMLKVTDHVGTTRPAIWGCLSTISIFDLEMTFDLDLEGHIPIPKCFPCDPLRFGNDIEQ
jgi:hypothetical protein